MTAQRSLRDFSMILALGAIAAYFSLASPQFLSARNLSMLAIELSITATLALGMLLIILPGHIDLSAGSGVGLLGGIASVLVFHHGWPAPAAMALSLLVGILVWFLMGSLVVRQRMPAFIITLGGLLVFKGLFWLVIENTTVPIVAGGMHNLYSSLTTYYLSHRAGWVLAAAVTAGCAFVIKGHDAEDRFMKTFLTGQVLFLFTLSMNQFRGIPLPVLILGLVAGAVALLTEMTPFGRHLYAIGGNEEAALVSGVPVQRTIITAFAIMGSIVAVTGFMQTAYAGASTTSIGELMELDAIAACVIGGTSLKGGRGSALRVLFGSLIMATLLNGMTLLAVSPEFKYIARGLVLALAVWVDVRLTR